MKSEPGGDSSVPAPGRPAHSSPPLWAKLILLVASALIALAVCEAALRIRWSPARAASLVENDDWWQWRWLEQRHTSKEATRLTKVNPLMVFSPTLGWRPTPNYREGRLSLNSRGVRGAREDDYTKPPGEKRVVVIGDSYTFGVRYQPDRPHIADDEVFTALVEQGLPGTRVFNLGVPGYGTDQQLLRLREEGFQYGPDLIIAAVHVDNLRRSTLSFRDYAKPWFEVVDGRLLLRGVPVPRPEVMEGTVKPRAPRLYIWALVEGVAFPRINALAPLGTLEVDRRNEAIFHALHREVMEKGARLLVVIIPHDHFGEELDRSERFLEDWGRRSGAPVLSLRRIFSELSPVERQKLAVKHWTPYGHRVAADGILGAIRELHLLEPVPRPAETTQSR